MLVRRVVLASILAAGLANAVSACHTLPLAAAGKARTVATGRPGEAASRPADAGTGVGASVHPVAITETRRAIDGLANLTSLTGKVKIIAEGGNGLISEHGGGLISDHGGALISEDGLGLISEDGLGVISNNSGNVISNNSGSLISNNGGNVISNNAGNLTAKAKYGLLQAPPRPAQFLLAKAVIEVLDARGRILVGKDGSPLGTTTDENGAFSLKTALPDEALVLRVRLYNGGQLFAIHAKGSPSHTLDLDTASSLSARYVVARYVQGNNRIFDRLPPDQNEALYGDMHNAQRFLPGRAPSYLPDELVAQAETLRGKSTALDQRLEKIRAILLAGQSDLGDGLQATQIALGDPVAVVGDAAGSVYIGEATAGRIRRVAPDGTIHLVDLTGTGKAAAALSAIVSDMAIGPDGALYYTESFHHRVSKVVEGHAPVAVAGNTSNTGSKADGPATERSLNHPNALAFTADGALLIAENGPSANRLMVVEPGGQMHALGIPAAWIVNTGITGVAVASDGFIYAAANNGQIARGKPGAPLTVLIGDLTKKSGIRLAAAPAGGIYVSETDAHRVWLLGADGSHTPLAGTGVAGDAGDGGLATAAQLSSPEAVWLAPDGGLLIADSGNGLVRHVDKAGKITTIAGTRGEAQLGNALGLPINQPTGLAVDAQGRLLVVESGGGTIKRLQDGKFTIIAGGGTEMGNAPATSARLAHPIGIAVDGDQLYVCDTANQVLRRIAADGTIATVAGSGVAGLITGRTQPALEMAAHGGYGVAIAPDHRPYWAESENNQILRLNPDGQAEIVVGKDTQVRRGNEGDGGEAGPGYGFLLNRPAAVAFGPKGDLYFVDIGNMRVRKLDPSGNVTTVAGLGLTATLAKIAANSPVEPDGSPAHDAMLAVPTGLTIDTAGNLYISEVGTENLDSLPDLAVLPSATLKLLPKAHARIRRITPDGKISMIAGQGSKLLADSSGDNTLIAPFGLLWNADRIFIADAGLNQVKVLPAGSF